MVAWGDTINIIDQEHQRSRSAESHGRRRNLAGHMMLTMTKYCTWHRLQTNVLVSPSSGTFSTNFNPPLPQQGSDEWLNRGNYVKCNGYSKKLWKSLHFITLVSGGSIRRIYNQLKTETISIYALRQMFSKTGDDLWFARGANTLLLNNIRTPRTNRQVVETLQLYNKKHEHK